MIDGLYFWNIWIADVEVAISLQANDLSSPESIQTSVANMFTLSDTTVSRFLLQNAEQLDAGGADPYRRIPATLLVEGEVVFTGFATLLTFQNGWKVSLSSVAKGLFENLADTKLTDLDLTKYNHPWTIPIIESFASNTEGIVYPAIDYGSMSNQIFAQDTLCPAIFVKTLVSAMLHQFGYRAIGDWLNDPLVSRMVLPFVEEEPTAHTSEWQADRMARVTVTGAIPLPGFGNFATILNFNRDAEPLLGWTDGKQNNFHPEINAYVCDVDMRLHVQASQEFALIVEVGAVEAFLYVEKNGQQVANMRVAHGGPYNRSGGIPEQLVLDTYVDCKAGDQIKISFYIHKQTVYAEYTYVGFISDSTTWASFEPDTTIRTGDDWIIASNLPDMTGADIMRTIALMTLGTYEVDEVAKTLQLRTMNGVLANEYKATDLSDCIETEAEPELAVTLSPYCQKNYLKWKQQDNKLLVGYGDGTITCSAQNIALEYTLFELPLSAVIDSKTSLPNYGVLPFIETRTVTGSGSSLSVQRKTAPPCFLLVEPTKPVTVTVNVVTPELTVEPTAVKLSACWWHSRPVGLRTSDNNFSLAFDKPVGTSTGEQTLIPRYFKPLNRILRRPRQFSPSFYLRAQQLATLDLYTPVQLRSVKAGSLDINNQYFYLNKVNQWIKGKPCTIALIPY